jgi:eukaryotic-like serine/threonine-protein kinase
MSSYPVNIGERIAGKYVVERVIGEGGMGLVVAARHVELDQVVAIKFLLPQIAEHATAAQRFRREARAAARIRGEHACRILDVATLDSGVPYMVMEYLEGCDLSTELLRRRRLPPEEAVDYLLQACEALAEAHAGGIVHRDLKPGNFFLAVRSDGTRCLKVLDFGVSKLLSDSDGGGMGLTSTASMIGSPLYMSPEQLESAKDVDARTDIWGLGCVLYELVTGRTPFLADSLAQLTHAVLSAQPPSCATLGIHVPEGLEMIIMRALSKRREQRFASVAELARALVPYGPAHGAVSAARVARMLPGLQSSRAPSITTRAGMQGTGSSSGTGSRDGFQSAARGSTTPASWERRSHSPPSRLRWGLAAGAVALLLIGGLVYRLTSGTDTPGSPEPVQRSSAAAPAPGAEHEVIPAGLEAQPSPATPHLDTMEPRGTPAVPSERANLPSSAAAPAPEPPAVAPAAAQRPVAPKAREAARARSATPNSPPNSARKPAEPERPAASGNISDFGGRR